MTDDTTPSLADIDALAQEAFKTIPTALREPVRDVVIRVVDLPDAEICDDLDLASPYDLLGLYQGIPIDTRSVLDPPLQPDMIFLYRLSLLRYAADTGETLPHLVRHVLIHEIGHHFGFSDAEMAAIEAES